MPDTMLPGGKPVTALPGLTPKSPLEMLGPVLVTVEPPNTAKLCADPSDGAVWATAADGHRHRPAMATIVTKLEHDCFIEILPFLVLRLTIATIGFRRTRPEGLAQHEVLKAHIRRRSCASKDLEFSHGRTFGNAERGSTSNTVSVPRRGWAFCSLLNIRRCGALGIVGRR
jgi:hypothetical protein